MKEILKDIKYLRKYFENQINGFNLEEFDDLIKITERLEAYILNQSLSQPSRFAKIIDALRIIKQHKLLNYVIKNPKFAAMYHLTNEEIKILEEVSKSE